MDSSTNGSYADSPTADKFSSLPITYMKDKIVEKIMENRVTLIVGETGCGKSSQVPQFLLENGAEPILCTQPRRFAVVAVARMVAKSRNCEVGTEVGYHIGHSKVFSKGSKIVFKTSGVLLDEMRDKGMNALKYKVIILDEAHERSVESDLVLVCVKQLMLKNNDLRVVLMSATADTTRYKDYFRDLGRGERVEVLAIPSSDERSFFQKKVLYLEQIAALLGKSTDSSDSLSATSHNGPTPDTSEPSLKPELHNAIHDLVMHIHNNEADVEKSILIFLPTYNALEQQWSLLKRYSSIFKVHILHSSIDTEQALSAMKIWKFQRKVVLATNIAESSVTIPKVAYVIDSCRSLQVYWDSNRKTEASHLVWVSKSQAEQRRGRTGRTCDGHVYRLVTRSFFNRLQDHESPAILKLSLRQQVLSICCAESRVINDPKVILQKTMDPPDPEVVEDALSLLVHIRALKKMSPRGRYVPTFYGKILSSFSLSFDASVLIVKFGDMGMLREGILIGILMDTQPLPILRPFGEDNLFATYSDSYYIEGTRKESILSGKKELNILANLCAYQFWQRVFKDTQRLEYLKQLLKNSNQDWNYLLLSKIEEEWCAFHKLVKSSLHAISEIYDDVLSSLHIYRPRFLVASNGRPLCYAPCEFQHTCLLQQLDEDLDSLHSDAGLSTQTIKCVAEPYVGSEDFQIKDVAINLAQVVKEIRIQFTEDASENQSYPVLDVHHSNGEEAIQCTYFARGMCNKGSQCLFSHSINARVSACKFFFSLQGCRNGDSCYFSHTADPYIANSEKSSLCNPEDKYPNYTHILQFFPKSAAECVLLLDESNLHFSLYVSHLADKFKIFTPTTLPISSTIFNSVRVLWSSHAYREAAVRNLEHDDISWDKVKSVFWFPTFDSCGQNKEEQRNLVKIFFQDMALRVLRDSLFSIRIIITMNSIRFSQTQVEKWARNCFFFLGESFPFDELTFGDLKDEVTFKKDMVNPIPVSYVFHMHPTKDIRSYANSLQLCESLSNLHIN